jgi:hypothetical protein
MVPYLPVASGIVFMVDPLQMSEVRQLLPPTVRLHFLDPFDDPNAIIGRVLPEFENWGLVVQGGRLSTPVAVVFTKCDVLRDHNLIDANRLWSTNKHHVGYFDREIHDDMSSMWGEYLQQWDARLYNLIEARFSRHAFFGVSATGCSSDRNRYPFISPWRVEDPLLWLLAELGVLPTDRDKKRKRSILSRWFQAAE